MAVRRVPGQISATPNGTALVTVVRGDLPKKPLQVVGIVGVLIGELVMRIDRVVGALLRDTGVGFRVDFTHTLSIGRSP